MFLPPFPLRSLVLRGHEQILWTKIVNGIVSFIQKVGNFKQSYVPTDKVSLAVNIWQRIFSKECAFTQGKYFVQ